MANFTQNESLSDDPGELAFLFDSCAREIIKSPDPATFLDWFADIGPTLAPSVAAQVDPRTGPPSLLFRVMGIGIYNAMPQPESGFRPRKLPVPGRNEPCNCGSGVKYKHCCLALSGMFNLSDYNMLRHVLDHIPQQRFSTLPETQVDPFGVYDTARQWQEEGLTTRAVALLEPWFSGSKALARAVEPHFDQLMDCYLELGNSRKRKRLVTQVIERGDKVLRAVALHRRSVMLADHGDTAGAWKAFADAQRMDPDSPSHASLELTLLMSQGDADRARDRARFWLARLERMRDPAPAELINFVRAVKDDPHAAMSSVDRRRHPGLDQLAALLAAAPSVTAHYIARNQREGEHLLQPNEPLRKLEKRWRVAFPQAKPALTATNAGEDEMWQDPQDWLDFLAHNPLAWQSFDVLDDLVLAVEALPTLGADVTILEPLLARGVALLTANLGAVADRGTLPWVRVENRPALRLLAHRVFRALKEPARGVASDDFIEHAEMLLALNPHDNHGIREQLSLAYLTRGWPDKAITLTDRYPNDFCGPTLNRILALVRVGRVSDAVEAVRAASEYHHVALKMLLAEKPRQPKADNGVGIALGGAEEAWMYRTTSRAQWELDGALDWLSKAWKSIGAKRE